MRKIIYYITFLLLISVQSCKLEQVNYNEINPDIFPKNESDVKSLVNAGVYYVFEPWSVFNVATGYITTSEMVTDYAENSWGWTTVYNTYEANDWHIDGDGRRVYDWSKYLSSMTLTLERIKNVSIKEELKERYIAEIKCGRGFLAFLMYDMYGPIPIPALEVLQKPAEQIIVPRLSEEEMQSFIETNLKEAAEILPYSYQSADYGRFTKGLANTLLMKFYMMVGRWNDAELIGRQLTGDDPSYQYELVNDYNSLFSLSTEQNSEVIYSAIAKTGFITHQWFAHVLPSDYPTADGITKWNGYKLSWPLYNSFEPNDKRLENIIGEYTGTDGTLHNYDTDRNGGTVGVLYYGAIPLKYDLDGGGTVGAECEIDMPIYRYADVLTLLAEAIVRNGNKVTQEAVNLLNKVRTTHGGLEPYKMTDLPTVTIFLEKLLEERGHEFYYEGVRRQDLIRHGKFIEAAQAKARWAGQTEDAIQKIATQVDGKYKYERFPIPTSVINEGKGVIKQNPGF